MIFIYMFKQLYYKILCQNYSDIQQKYKVILFNKLMNQQLFKKFIKSNIGYTDIQMSNQMIQFYQQNKEQAIKSALTWKSFAAISQQYILLSYYIQPGKEDTQVLHFVKYNIKNQCIDQQMYSIYGKSKYMFFNMDNKHQSLNKIYNTMKKYAFKIY